MKRTLLVVLAVLFIANRASAAKPPVRDLLGELRAAVAASAGSVSDADALTPVEPHTPCYAGEIRCAQTKTGRVSVDSCEVDFVYAVGYLFVGTKGQVVTITGRSPEFAASIFLGDGRSGQTATYAQDHVFVDGATARISNFTLPYSGDYFVVITPLEEFEFGDYTVTVSCQSAPPPPPPPPPCISTCTPNANTACMLNNRFKVTMTWNDQSAGLSGAGRLITYADNRPVVDPTHGETSESTFWSMYAHNPDSIEALVRMIRGFDTYWVFVTGFASAEYSITVQDTRTCTSWVRTIPFGSKEKIVDFGAFPFP